ncbi:MAG TPA: hypothetical protein VE057_01890 [Archangium sp.]|nr:hypothetical protein [Archangium sp.]
MFISRADVRAMTRFASLLGLVLLGGACSRTPPAPHAFDAGSGDPIEQLDGSTWTPRFEPDFNNLRAQPWVEVVTAQQARTVVVTPDSLRFPRQATPEVLQWEPGRVVVAGPSEGSGANLLGFARRVTSVSSAGSTIVVHTEPVALQDIITGDLQQTLDFSRMKDVDLSKLDLQWAANRLYVDAGVLSSEIDSPLHEDAAPDSAAKAVARAAADAWRTVTSASFEKSVSISPEIKVSQQVRLFSLEPYTKSFNDSGHVPLELTLQGVGDIAADVTFKPGAQLGMRIPNVGQDGTLATWMNVDSQYQANIRIEVALEARVGHAKDKHGSALEEALSKQADVAGAVLNEAREKLMNDPDMKPVGGWKRTLFITKPATQVVMAGPVPVVFTQTFQLDLECGFEAKAGIKAKMEYNHATVLKFSARYEDGKVTGSPPVFESHKDSRVEVTAGGGLSVSCGLIPRVNVFVYDTAGLNVGVRGSVVARADYGARCAPGSLGTPPKSEVTLGLYGNFGIQVGGRLQVPGSSYAQEAGGESGFDIGPLEVWNKEISISSQVWSLEGGLGYCMPPCHNTCGYSCPKCAVGARSAVAAHCVSGVTDGQFCVAGTCWDRVLSGEESDIDCGGPLRVCKRCDAGQKCGTNADCSESAPVCDRATLVCSPPRCSDNILNGDETDIDCGGSCSDCSVPAAPCNPAREGCIDESTLRLAPHSQTPSALLRPSSLDALASMKSAGADFARVLSVPVDLKLESTAPWSNKPASWEVQSEALGDGQLRSSSSQSGWNQVLVPVIRWGASK